MSFIEPSLWAHQKEAIRRALEQGNFAFFMDMGTGKTCTTIQVLRRIYNEHKRILRTVVLCPSIVVENWPIELTKFSKTDPSRIIVLKGTEAQRRKIFAEAMVKHHGNFIVVTNYEKLVNFKEVRGKKVNCSDVYGLLMEWGPEVLILDESHRCKDLAARRTQAVLNLSQKRTNPSIKHKYILTGTPVLRDPMDLFSQFLILDEGETFGREFWPFKLRYMEDKNAKWKGKPNYFPKWELKPSAVDEIHAKIQSKSLSVKKSECLDLPPLVTVRRYVGMTPQQLKHYTEMKRDFITFINEEASVAQLALTKALRLLQIASGYVQTEEGKTHSLKDTPKQEALKELLTDLTPSGKVIVWSVFQENYAQIRKVCDALKLKYVEVHGEVPEKKKFENVTQFNTDPDTQVLIGHPGSGGIGINLVQAPYAIFYSRGFSYGDDSQARARNYRGGSEMHEKVTHYDLVAKDTIDELVLERLEKKEAISESILREMVREL